MQMRKCMTIGYAYASWPRKPAAFGIAKQALPAPGNTSCAGGQDYA